MKKTSSNTSDLKLLRKYEPVLRFTKGEIYFPTDIDRYIKNCSLWVSHANKKDEKIVAEGELTPKKLAAKRDLQQGDVLYMRFVDLPSVGEVTKKILDAEPLEMRAKKRGWKPGRSRLARVGYSSRIIDALFSLTLLARGKVPGIVAALAQEKSQKITKRAAKPAYYGRVFRENDWIGLQYWYFYHYDDWRTSFEGVNDHEADWETISIYLYKDKNKIIPKWVVFSCHDFTGDDLRRRWDDPDLEKIDAHPVAYIGAGSHAAYYKKGEYLIESELPYLYRLLPAINKVKRFWQVKIRQNFAVENLKGKNLTIPFVEYARGDGKKIGPKEELRWEAVLLTPSLPWLTEYRGLWGLFTRDPIGGEDAPAGPMYNRDGSPRFSWYDPLGFSGLDKVPTPPKEIRLLNDELKKLKKRETHLKHEIKNVSENIQILGTRNRAYSKSMVLTKENKKLNAELDSLLAKLQPLRLELAKNSLYSEKISERLRNLKKGSEGAPQDHVQISQEPTTVQKMRFDRLTEIWSALSMGLLLVGFVLIVVFLPSFTIGGIVLLIISFLLTEALFRGKFAQTIRMITVFLAIASLGLIIFTFFWSILIALILAGGIYLLYNNIRESF